jgi:hypothetical protein
VTIVSPPVAPALQATSLPDDIDPTVPLLNARSVCEPIEGYDSVQASPTTSYICVVSVPPVYADGFVDVIVMGFNKRPVHDDYVLQRMSQASQAIIK